jgi:hypothetical protein
MQPTRRALLQSGATLLGSAALGLRVPVRAATSEFKWKHYGAAPFATNERDALKALPQVLTLLGIPERYHGELIGLVQAHPHGLRHGQLERGDRLAAMLSKGGVVHRNVLVDFKNLERGIGPHAYTYEWEFELGTLILPLVCFNWSWRRGCDSCSCYVIPLDYSATPGVQWDAQHRALVSVHMNATESELETVWDDSCFGIADSRGTTKPFHRCEFCERGIYPPPDLAAAVGLPRTEPQGTFAFHLQDGIGRFLLPKAWAARWMVFCVTTKPYYISVPLYRSWQAVSRFDVVPADEIERTLPSGRLDRTLSGQSSY